MEFNEFKEKLCKAVEEKLAKREDGKSLRVSKVVKNNGTELTSLSFYGEKISISPTMYAEDFYSLYQEMPEENGDEKVNMVADELIRFYDERMSELNTSVVLEDIFERLEDKGNIIMTLVNYEKNKKSFDDRPYIRFHDLAVTFRRVLGDNSKGLASAAITNRDLETLGMDIHELFILAKENTQRKYPLRIVNVLEYLNLNCGEDLREFEERYGFSVMDCRLYLITNQIVLHGATVMLYDGALEECAEQLGGDLYIIPSSTHELIAIVDSNDINPGNIKQMIVTTNATVVKPGDYLSDSLYYYQRDTRQLSIV